MDESFRAIFNVKIQERQK